jgi:hypothetical protein
MYKSQQSHTQKTSMNLYMAAVMLSLQLSPSSSSSRLEARYMLILRCEEVFLDFRDREEPRLAAWLIMSFRTITSEREEKEEANADKLEMAKMTGLERLVSPNQPDKLLC